MKILVKWPLFTWALAFNMIAANAQTFFSEQGENLIYYSPDIAPTAVCVGDIEGDDDQDILSFFDKWFRLYEHSDDNGTFSEHMLINVPDDWILSVHISDLNNDGEPDILAASYNNDKIVWYENEGNLAFGTEKTITDSARGASSVYAADLDRDGDQDVISASIWDHKIAWYENTGGGIFGEQQVITALAEGARYVYVSDLNGDTLQDVISASIYDHKIAWYENKGGGVFGVQKVITDSAARAMCVFTSDLDQDGDLDVLSASSWDNKIAWYKNDGQGNFGAQRVISNSLISAQSVFAADLDGDTDPDVLSASLLDNKIAWYENNGTGVFGKQQVVTDSADMPGFVYATDIDGDGYRDILTASTDFKIAWYENSLPMNIRVNPRDTAVYPDSNAGFAIIAGSAAAYHWQCDEGNGFNNLTNNNGYEGVSTNTLQISGATFDMQGNKYRCLAINGSDSLGSASAVLTIIDAIKPVITSVHADTILPADWNCMAEIPDYTGTVKASDNSYGTLNISQDPVPWSKISGPGVVVKLTASDPQGNSTYVTFNVVVDDQTPPDYNMSDLPDVDTNSSGQFFLPDYTLNLDVTDNCSEDSALVLTQEPAPGYIFPDTVSMIPVTLTVRDEAGNSSQVSFKAYTIDVIPPLITSTHNDAEVEGNYACVAYMPDFTGDVEATDNFDGFSELVITQSPDPYTVIMGPENEVTLTVRDQSGNAADVSFNVAVLSQKPIINCIQDQILNLEEGQTAYTVSGTEFDPLSLEFYCGFTSLTNNINASTTLKHVEFSQDTTHVVWTLTDNTGNIAQCSFNVIMHRSVGIETLQQHGISVYPNPTTGDIFVESSVPVRRIRILDLKGSILMDGTDIRDEGQINIAGYRTGPYILNIVTDQKVFKVKIVKD